MKMPGFLFVRLALIGGNKRGAGMLMPPHRS